MNIQYYGAITALEFDGSSIQLFKEIVESLDCNFRPYGLTCCSLNWPDDKVAIIERDSLRLLLGWLPAESDDDANILVFSVGHTTDGGNLLVPRETCEYVKEVLVGHLESYLRFKTVFDADATQPVDIELVSTVAEILGRGRANSCQIKPQTTDERHPRRIRAHTRDIMLEAATLKKASPPTAHQFPELVDDEWHDDAVDKDELSLPKRLAIYALGATMLIYTPPVGATLLVYTTLRDFNVPQQPDKIAA